MPRRNAIQGPKRQREDSDTWKCLNAADIESILESVGLSLDRHGRHRLKRAINEELVFIGNCRDSLKASPLHRHIQTLEKIQDSAKALRCAIKQNRYDLAYGAHYVRGDAKEPASLEALQECWPNLTEHQLKVSLLMAAHVPSAGARSMVAKIYEGLKWLERCVGAIKAIDLRQQEKLGTKNHPQRIDYHRYALVANLAVTFAQIFGMKATTTEDSPWCLFLAEVLTCCEKKPLTPSGARDLWFKVRRWQRDTEDRG